MNKNHFYLKNFSISRFGVSNSLFWWFLELVITSGGVIFLWVAGILSEFEDCLMFAFSFWGLCFVVTIIWDLLC
jgi:hypothetical protein